MESRALRDFAVAIRKVEHLRRKALYDPDAAIGQDLDGLIRSVRNWTSYGDRWRKMYKCRTTEHALMVGRSMKDWMARHGVSGGSTVIGDGGLVVEMWAMADADDLKNGLDALHRDSMALAARCNVSRTPYEGS